MMGESFVEFRDNSVELVEANVLVGCSFLVDMSAVQHLQKVIIIDAILNPLGDSLKLFKVKNSILILVVKSKDFFESVFGLVLTDSGADDVKEFIKVNGSVLILESIDEAEDEGVGSADAEFFKGLVDFFRVNSSTSVLIKDLEGVFQVIKVLFRDSIFPAAGLAGDWGLCGFGVGSTHLDRNQIIKINKDLYQRYLCPALNQTL